MVAAANEKARFEPQPMYRYHTWICGFLEKYHRLWYKLSCGMVMPIGAIYAWHVQWAKRSIPTLLNRRWWVGRNGQEVLAGGRQIPLAASNMNG